MKSIKWFGLTSLLFMCGAVFFLPDPDTLKVGLGLITVAWAVSMLGLFAAQDN